MPVLNEVQEKEGFLKKMFRGNNGVGKFSVGLATNSIMIDGAARLRIVINNSDAKLNVAYIRAQLTREIKITAETTTFVKKEFTDK